MSYNWWQSKVKNSLLHSALPSALKSIIYTFWKKYISIPHLKYVFPAFIQHNEFWHMSTTLFVHIVLISYFPNFDLHCIFICNKALLSISYSSCSFLVCSLSPFVPLFSFRLTLFPREKGKPYLIACIHTCTQSIVTIDQRPGLSILDLHLPRPRPQQTKISLVLK